MGNAQSPILAQGVTDRVVSHAITTLGYLDDFLPYSLTLDGMYLSIEFFLVRVIFSVIGASEQSKASGFATAIPRLYCFIPKH